MLNTDYIGFPALQAWLTGAVVYLIGVLLSQGRPVAEAIRAISVTPFTYYRWRREFTSSAGWKLGRRAER